MLRLQKEKLAVNVEQGVPVLSLAVHEPQSFPEKLFYFGGRGFRILLANPFARDIARQFV